MFELSKSSEIMLELSELSEKKEGIILQEGSLKNATEKIIQYHRITKNAILGISMILSDIAERPKEYLEKSKYSTISEYAEEMFGYKKAYTYKLIKISKFVSIKSITGEKLSISDLINDKLEVDYTFESIADNDGFEFSPSQMLELIPLTKQQIEDNLKLLDSALTCKELRSIVKDIVNPPIEVKGEESKGETTETTEDNKEEPTPLTDKERIMQMLELCSSMENEEIKDKIINVFQKALKSLEK